MSASGDREPIGRLFGMTIDVHDLEVARDFWRAALGLEVEIENDEWVLFKPQPGCTDLSLQKVTESKGKKNRAHPDFRLADYPGGARLLEQLGAQTVREVIGVDNQWHIMLDPDGNEFCAIK